ncbi:low molecular weight protein-tyrosine-phosphatase [Patulibacter brassicae]|uniref:protein-tyrosine-phosphatase n=1 Tax=Patulibacter brassicae TaxID=1705717 RepID=A0ABU4VHG2_9ACTN|nr:low molecular weight protein-tyrosine-phosphatase [Patulibacter brassicae]MDX8150376.1 low molecular weight protein-tyrosine-phosphatase [Patulibacter brassicae]
MELLFVCLGNICRSPTAEAVMAGLLADEGLDDRVHVDSAGTGSWHVGHPADPRSRAAAAERGIALTSRARQVTEADFERFDLLLAMDRQNAADLRALAPDDAAASKVRLLREFDAAAARDGDLDVPDPYHGGPRGFEHVLDLVDAACRGLLAEVRSRG